MDIRVGIRSWWEGECPPDLDRGGSVVILARVRRHWTARACRAVLEYAQDNHRWLIATFIAAAGVLVAALKL